MAGESQSRFSIIDELIQRKSTTQNEILAAEKSVRDEVGKIAKWEKDVMNTREVFNENLVQLKTDVEAKIIVLRDRLTELDKGITAIQSISVTK